MENTNYWESVQATDEILPNTYLKQQSEDFNNAMKENLSMRIKSHQQNDNSWVAIDSKITEGEKKQVIELYIEVPSLKGYTLSILEVTYKPSTIYPCSIENIVEGKDKIEAINQETFKTAIDKIIKSDTLRNIVSNLLAQVKANL